MERTASTPPTLSATLPATAPVAVFRPSPPPPYKTLRATQSMGCSASKSTAYGKSGTRSEAQRNTTAEDRSMSTRKSIPTVNWTDISLHETLGCGNFCEARMAYIRRYSDGSKPKQQIMAVKLLNAKTLHQEDPDHVKMAAADLVLEGAVLAKLDHPNIIKLHGVSATPIHDASSRSNGYFLVLDLLECTLSDRLKAWRSSKVSVHRRTLLPSPFTASATRRKILERVEQVGLGIAMGMDYLHEQNIIIRDLKPCNVGFDHSGVAKLFDFGLAREVHRCANEIAGSLRYMAPEMSVGTRISLKSDVYSFGVLLYELCTLKKPYAQYEDMATFREKVFHQKRRPSLRYIPSGTLRRLITSCWDECPDVRPSFRQIVRILVTLLQQDDPSYQAPKHASFQGQPAGVAGRASRGRKQTESPRRARSGHTRSTSLCRMLPGIHQQAQDDLRTAANNELSMSF